MGFFLKLYKGSNRGDPVTDGNPLPVKVMSGGGGGGSGTEYTQDAAAPTNPVGGAEQLRRTDTPASVGADGDWITARATAKGEKYVKNLDTDTRLGEVQALPTANTVLGRLRDLLTGIVLAAGANIIGKVGIDQTTPGTTNAVVMKNSSGSEISFADPTTGTLSQVGSSATAVTVLAANTSRKGATIFNDSTQVLYLGLSNTTPTSSAYSVKMAAASYYEVPNGYNGIIKGIWASANGNAVVTELT